MKKFCIVIPIYKEELDCVEEISLNRLNTVIGEKGYDVYLVYPENMTLDNYYKIYKNLLCKSFDPLYFTNTMMYSQLCIDYNFYDAFSNYEYMLIYQLDCYLFFDAIEEWCNKGYDYIGGPIISTDCGWDTLKKNNEKNKKGYQPYVGNGGLSLRKINTFKDICNPNGELRKTYNLTDEVLANVKYEDKYFCNDLYEYYRLNIPNWKEAFSFAIDMSVDVVYNLFKLDPKPMGIHSVDKNIRWWKNHIEEFSDKNVIDYCEKKHEKFFKIYYDENDSTIR
jgi:hypothetical protein